MTNIYQGGNLTQGSNLFTLRGDLDGAIDAQDFENICQFIGLYIGEGEFLLPIEVMNEIIMVHALTFVPGAPNFIEGVINLRGNILPAINLRKMMGLETSAPTSQSRIIVANYEDMVIGLIVDGISYVITLNEDDVLNQTLPGKGPGAELVSSISKRGDQVNGILDIAKIVQETGYDPSKEDADSA